MHSPGAVAPDDLPDFLDTIEPESSHPVPHPGCMLCDPAIVASKRARFGLVTRPAGSRNRIRIEAGMVMLTPRAGAR